MQVYDSNSITVTLILLQHSGHVFYRGSKCVIFIIVVQ
jgi:hypothetical protein